MSRFHFDENVMENAAASLKAVNQELGGCLVELMLIKTVVQKEKGYNINEICNKLGIENGKMANCNENIDEGTDAIRQIENDIHICNQKIVLVNKFENISTIIESSESKPGGCVGSEDDNFDMIDCQVKCNKINEKIYKALRWEYENQGVYGDDY